MNVTNWSIRHSVTVFVLMAILGIGGMIAYNGLPREAAPDVKIPFVIVTTPYIGVAPSDIETLVTNPIEDELEQLKDVEKINSTSAEGASIISIEFQPGVDIDSAMQKVREKVDQAKPELPPDAEDPIIAEISFSEFPVMVVNVSGDVGLVQLKTIAESVQEKLERIPGVLEVKLTGGLERQIRIEPDPNLLNFYSISITDLLTAIQQENLTMPGGAIDLGDTKYLVRVPGEFRAVHEIEDVVVKEIEGMPIFVRDVARVVDGFEDIANRSRLRGSESVSLSISRRAGENIIRITDEAKAIVAQSQSLYGERVRFTVLGDVSDAIRDQLLELENNILTGLILVVGVLLFFMGGLRNALFVAIAIPFSMLISFLVLAAMGVTLNIVVLFSLVLALGMLVDNAIVIVENVYRHVNMGKPRVEATMDAVAEVGWPVISSTATTVAAFLPLIFWPGIMGEFMYYMPLTVSIVLLASLFVALVINPVVCAAFMKTSTNGAQPSDDELSALPDNLLYRAYGATLRFALRNRALSIVGTIVAFIATFALYGKYNAGVEFFPKTTPERIFINVVLPDGSNLEASDRIVRMVERALADEKNIENWVADVGAGTGGGMNFGGSGSTPHQSSISVDFLPLADQIESAYVTIERIRGEILGLTGAEIEIKLEEGGPPSGAPITIEISGDDYAELGRLATRVVEFVQAEPGTVNIKDDLEDSRSEIRIVVDRQAAALAKANTRAVANTVRGAINGIEASVFREADEEYDIVVRLQPDFREDLEDIRNLRVPVEGGAQIPLGEIATVEIGQSLGSIRHLDGRRVVTVSADVAAGVNGIAARENIRAAISREMKVPAGYSVNFTGQNKDQEEAQAFLGKALLIGLFLIALTLVTQFNSILQTLIIFSSVILSLLGVFGTLLLRQLPFNIIMTGVGVISLAGVVVNNAIVLIDYINQLRERGEDSTDAVLRAGMLRLRPVLLTAVTTMLSLLPTVLGISLNVRQLSIDVGGRSVEMWGPMANAVVGGLFVSTFLTLVLVPVLYSTIDSMKRRLGGSARTTVETDREPEPEPDADLAPATARTSEPEPA